jgi:hypothetical protein
MLKEECIDYCSHLIYTNQADKQSILRLLKHNLTLYRNNLSKDLVLSDLQLYIPNIKDIINKLDPDITIAMEQLWQYLINNTKSY